MELSIIILNYKTKGLVKYCLKNVINTVKSLNYEIIVVDNGSNDGISDMLAEKFSQVRFLQTGKNLGFAAGYNVGLKEARGKYILVLTADVSVLDGSVEKMVEFMEKNPQVGLAGPKIVNPDGSYQITCRTFQTPQIIIYRRTPFGYFNFAKKELAKHLMTDFDRQTSREVDWVMGACMIVRKSVLDKVGLFDERFFFYVEDMDWCRRFWANGYKVMYIADAKVIHLYEKASDHGIWKFWKLDKMARWHMISGIKYIFKYLGEKQHVRTQ
jgi:hypothetical protein